MSGDTESRLMRAEMQLEHHGKLHEETQTALKDIATAVQALAQAEVRREQDQSTFARIFDQIEEQRKRFDEEAKAIRKNFEDYKDAQQEKELAAYRGIVWKILGLAGVVVASVIAGHYGVHLLG